MLIDGQGATLARSADRVDNWLSAFEYSNLIDSSDASSVPVIERFGWDGQKIEPGFRRVRVIGRQLYVLCEAALTGNEEAAELARRVARCLISQGLGGQGQFVSRLAPDGSALDQTADLYDIAFALFGLAWWYRVCGDDTVLAVAESVIGKLRKELRSPSGRGYRSRSDLFGGHEQNPHMHLFEAAIFLMKFADRPIFRFLADEIFSLAECSLFNSEKGTLPEIFDRNWQEITKNGAVLIEPGHQYEWVWLLHQYGLVTGRKEPFEMADKLFAFARQYGHNEETKLIVDGVAADGRLLRPDFRIWPNTEFLKAQIAMRQRYGSGPGFTECEISETVDRIFFYYLEPSVSTKKIRRGLWIDYLYADAVSVKSDHVPASSLYHIVLGFSELLRHTRSLVPSESTGAPQSHRSSIRFYELFEGGRQ